MASSGTNAPVARTPVVLRLLNTGTRVIKGAWTTLGDTMYTVHVTGVDNLVKVSRTCDGPPLPSPPAYAALALVRAGGVLALPLVTAALPLLPAAAAYSLRGSTLPAASTAVILTGALCSGYNRNCHRPVAAAAGAAAYSFALDICYTVVAVVTCAMLVRAPPLAAAAAGRGGEGFRAAARREACNSAALWAASVPAAVALVGVLRAGDLRAAWARLPAGDYTPFAAAAARAAAATVADWACVSAAVLLRAVTEPYYLPRLLLEEPPPPPPHNVAGAGGEEGWSAADARRARFAAAARFSAGIVPEVAAGLVVVATLARAPKFVSSVRSGGWHRAEEAERRAVGTTQLCYLGADVVTTLLMAPAVLTLYRLPRCVRILQTEPAASLHRKLLEESWSVVSRDSVCWLKGVVVLLNPYRFKKIVKTLVGGGTIEQVCAACDGQFRETCLDIPYIPPALVVLCSWRAPRFLRDCSRDAAAAQCRLLAHDVRGAAAVAVLLCTVYRFRTRFVGSEAGLHAAPAEARQILTDLPYIAASPALLLRPTARRECTAAGADAAVRRAAVARAWRELGAAAATALVTVTLWRRPFLADFDASLPEEAVKAVLQLPLSLALYGCLWRLPRTYRLLCHRRVRPNDRLLVLVAGVLTTVADVPCAAMYVVTMCTVWRAETLRSALGAARDELGEDVLCDGPLRALTEHAIVAGQFARLLLDLALLASTPLSLWRARGSWAAARATDRTGYTAAYARCGRQVFLAAADAVTAPAVLALLASWRHGEGRAVIAAAQQTESPHAQAWLSFFALAADVACALPHAVVVATGWRRRTLAAALEKLRTEEDRRKTMDAAALRGAAPVSPFSRHRAVLVQFVRLLADAPLLAGTPLALWRARAWWAAAAKVDDTGYAVAYAEAAAQAALCAADALAAAAALLLAATWRHAEGVALAGRLRSGKAGTHAAAAKALGTLAADVPHAALAAVTPWRLRLPLSREGVRRSFGAAVLDVASVAVLLPPCALPWNTLPLLKETAMGVVGVVMKAGSKEEDTAEAESKTAPQPPLYSVQSCRVSMPDNTICDGNRCGLRVVVCVRRRGGGGPPTDLKMSVRGPAFWAALEKQHGAATIAVGRSALFPLALKGLSDAEEKLAAATDDADTTTFRIDLGTGVGGGRAVSQATMSSALRAVVDGGASRGTPLELAVAGADGAPVCCVRLRLSDLLDGAFYDADAAAAAAALSPLPEPPSACPLHAAAQRAAFSAWPAAPVEVAAAAVSLLAPWRMPKVASELFKGDRALSGRVSRLKRCMLKCVADAVGVCCLGVLTLTVWRLPALRSTILQARAKKQPWKRALKHGVLTEIKEWAYDVLQLFELIYIAGTVVQLPSFAMRATRLARHAWAQRTAQAAGVVTDAWRRRAALYEAAAAAARGARGGQQEEPSSSRRSGPSADYPGIFPSDVTRLILDFVPPERQATVGAATPIWHCLASEDERWKANYAQHAWEQPPPRTGFVRDWRALFAKRYAEEAAERCVDDGQGSTVDAELLHDYQQGLRYVIQDEFQTSVSRFPHFVLLPAKVLGAASYAGIRLYMQVKMWAGLGRDVTPPTLMHAQHLETFWEAHQLVVVAPGLAAMHFVADAGFLLAQANKLLYCVVTLGAPYWHRLAPQVGDLLLGVALPVMFGLQLYLLCMWLPSTVVFWMEGGGMAGWTILSSGAHLARTVGEWVFHTAAATVAYVAPIVAHYTAPFVPGATEALAAASQAWADADAGPRLAAAVAALPALPAAAFPYESAAELQAALPTLLPGAAAPVYYALLKGVEVLASFEAATIAGLWYATFGVAAASLRWGARAAGWAASDLPVVGSWGRHAAIRCVWVAVLLRSWQVVFEESEFFAPKGSRPGRLYSLPVEIVRLLLRGVSAVVADTFACVSHVVRRCAAVYDAVLAAATRVGARLGMVGDLLLTVVTFVWAGWPLVVPWRHDDSSLYVTAVPLTLHFVVRARRVVAANWKE